MVKIFSQPSKRKTKAYILTEKIVFLRYSIKHYYKMRFFILTVLCCYCGWCSAQNTVLRIKDSIDCKADRIDSDMFGNLYVIKNQIFLKYDSSGNFLGQYSHLKLGNIHSMNVSNHQKLFLFYRESGYFVLLNNFLAPIDDPVMLSRFLPGVYSLACPSYSQGFWCYDQINRQLFRFDRFFVQTNESVFFTDYGRDFNPVQLMEVDEKIVVLFDRKAGVLFFDKFGTFIKKLQIPTASEIQISGDLIFYNQDNLLFVYNYQTLDLRTYEVPVENIIQIVFNQNGFYLLRKDGMVFSTLIK